MFLSKYCKDWVLGFLIRVFVLKRNGMVPPTPIDQVSAQSDKFCYAFVHPKSESVKTTILIAKVTLPKCQNFVIYELLSEC
jgi:hypothetical protein